MNKEIEREYALFSEAEANKSASNSSGQIYSERNSAADLHSAKSGKALTATKQIKEDLTV